MNGFLFCVMLFLLKRVISSHNSCGSKIHLKNHLKKHFITCFYKTLKAFCVFTCKKLDIFNIKN